jgi:D-hexose-6-phosphate mutarotase
LFPAFLFTACLHTYLRCSDISAVRLRGLKDTSFKDKAANGWQGNDLSELSPQTQQEEYLDVAQGQLSDTFTD